jgi:hypothetical protein
VFALKQKGDFIDLHLQVGGKSDFGREKRCIRMHRIVAALISDKLKNVIDEGVPSSGPAAGMGFCNRPSRSSVCAYVSGLTEHCQKRGAETPAASLSPGKRMRSDGSSTHEHMLQHHDGGRLRCSPRCLGSRRNGDCEEALNLFCSL